MPPYIADFACIERHVVIEIDGGYHDYIYAEDCHRQEQIEAAGWHVLRFSNEEVLANTEGVVIAIARQLGVELGP